MLHSAVVILSFVSFFWVSDLGFRHSIEATVNEASRTNLEVVRRLLENKASSGEDELRSELQELSDLWASGAIFEVADSKGNWIFRSPHFLDSFPHVPDAQGFEVSFLATNLEDAVPNCAAAYRGRRPDLRDSCCRADGAF